MSYTNDISPVGHETIPGPDGEPNVIIPRLVEPEWVLAAPLADGEAYEPAPLLEAANLLDKLAYEVHSAADNLADLSRHEPTVRHFYFIDEGDGYGGIDDPISLQDWIIEQSIDLPEGDYFDDPSWGPF